MMREVRVGGAEVSALCLGTMFFGSRVDEATSLRLLDAYVASGGRFLDTANNYAFWITGTRGGESEALLGRWLAARRNRDRIVLASKVGARPRVAGGSTADAEGLGGATIERAVEESLTRLGTDYLDLCYAHIDDPSTDLSETLAAFDRLVRAGKVRQIGCSNFTTARLAAAHGLSAAHDWAPYVCVQQRYSYLQPLAEADLGVQVAVSDELRAYCAAHAGVALLAYSPLLGGAYSRPDQPLPAEYHGAANEARLRALASVAAETGATSSQVVLSWLLGQTPAVLPLIAASNEAQLAENLAALDVRLTAAQRATLDAAGAGA